MRVNFQLLGVGPKIAKISPMATKILLVEDNADNLLVLAICLQIEGFTVEQAHDGSEAFQKLEDETFDVVVSDIRMPGLSGFDLVGRILERFAEMRIVLITADPRARRMATDNQAGVSSVLIKPFPIKELVRAIREAVPENDVKSVGRAQPSYTYDQLSLADIAIPLLDHSGL